MGYMANPETALSYHLTTVKRASLTQTMNSLTKLYYWFQFCDFYQFPYIRYFNSIGELVEILQTSKLEDLEKTSKRMKIYNTNLRSVLLKTWRRILISAAKFSPNYENIQFSTVD